MPAGVVCYNAQELQTAVIRGRISGVGAQHRAAMARHAALPPSASPAPDSGIEESLEVLEGERNQTA